MCSMWGIVIFYTAIHSVYMARWHYIPGFSFLAAKYRGRTSGWWLGANTPTKGSPSVFCSQKREPCCIPCTVILNFEMGFIRSKFPAQHGML
jgi:hypothetical protein